jgi:predicted Zn-dependent protease
MIRLSVRNFLFVFPLLFTLQARAQEPAPRVEEATSRSAAPATAPEVGAAPHAMLFGAFPVATRSPEARKLVEQAIDQYENVLLDESVSTAHQAAQKDPHFALAFAVWSFAARRNSPSAEALRRAEALAPHATPDEKLLVHWMTSVQKEDMLPAITATNDLLARYPNDKHVLYLTSEWLYFQQDYDRSRKIMEKVVKLDPNFPPILNMLGYAYVESGDPDPVRAVSYLQRYAQLQPHQPNPEDSLGEVLRFTGDDEGSLAHYTAALKIIPNFITSQVGLGDTLVLMGNYARARAEYDKAVLMATNPRDRQHAEYQKAMVYFWEGKPAEGRKALDALLDKTRKQKEPYSIFDTSLGRALLTPDFQSQLEQLRAIEASLQKPISGMSDSDRNMSIALVLREQVRIAAANHLSSAAEEALSKLEKFSTKSRDLTIGDSYESARGFLLLAQGDFTSAASGLAADPHSPVVLQALAATQDKVGDAAAAESTRRRIKYQRASTLEWFLITHENAGQSNQAAAQ